MCGVLDPGCSDAYHMTPHRIHLWILEQLSRAQARAVYHHTVSCELLHHICTARQQIPCQMPGP